MIHKSEEQVRESIAGAQIVVVKVGSSSLTQSSGHLDIDKLQNLVDAIAHEAHDGKQIILVSSGAVAAGFGPLGLDRRPDDVPTQQAAASVGQGVLMSYYEHAFNEHDLKVGQILITAQDTIHASQYRNARRTLTRLLELGVIPIINENDALASNELRFGDNDRLSALIANIVGAQALILLTDVSALYTDSPSNPNAQLISYVPNVVETMQNIRVGASTSGVGTGGMITKLEAVHIATASGIPVMLTSAKNASEALEAQEVGTVFAPIKHRGSFRRLWIGFASSPRGELIVDEGASQAIKAGTASLLAAGVTAVRGNFSASDAVWIRDIHGNRIAKGLSDFDSEEIPSMLGKTTPELRENLGNHFAHPIVHRDNLVVL